ncbi:MULTISPECIES: hypothetical protein [unclassified Sinorhizobium]|uniref:hypothetical protein n=1 Tax=unclassified Sinorhizobium TaxID=2613772 RepID=UPI003523F00A
MRDVAPRDVLFAGIMLFGGIALSVLVTFGILHFVSPAGQLRPPGFTQHDASAAPFLEVSPSANRAELQNRAQARITAYGRIDEGGQTARIPIDRAIDILAARGWPDPDRQGGEP